MFLPEELITYAVYSNPADFCQGTRLLKDGSSASFPGEEAGLTDTQATSGGPAWTGPGPQVVVGCGLNTVSRGAM